jgi:hypothetical protein
MGLTFPVLKRTVLKDNISIPTRHPYLYKAAPYDPWLLSFIELLLFDDDYV